MKTRRHHNNKGLRQIQRGRTRKQVERIRRRLKIPCTNPKGCECSQQAKPPVVCVWFKRRTPDVDYPGIEEPGYGYGV